MRRCRSKNRENRNHVLIIGGSNSVKYTPYVREFLSGKAVVDRVPDNARSTRYTLERLDGWLGDGSWQVIYFNWGMHDLTRVDGENPQVVQLIRLPLTTRNEE